MLQPNAILSLKPQNRIDFGIQHLVEERIETWLIQQNISKANAYTLRHKLVIEAIQQRVAETDPASPDVTFTDDEKADQLTTVAMELAIKLDNEGKLENLLH